MIVVRHICGHTQETYLDRLAKASQEKGYKTEEQVRQFLEEQTKWLEGHACPDCYKRAKGKR